MTTNVIMPVLGMVQDTGKIVRWLKRIGEPVRQGELLLEVETDKAVQELEAPASGILGQILAEENDEVPVTQVVAVILTPEEYRSSQIGGQVRATSLTTPLSPSENPGAIIANLTQPTLNTSFERLSGRILASPKARRLALETHQDLAALTGSGPGGAILARDVERIAQIQAPQIPISAEVALIPTQKPSDEIRQVQTRETMNPNRPLKVEPAAHSGSFAAQISFHRTVSAAQFLSWLNLLQINLLPIITLTDLMVLVVSRTLVKLPKINSVWQNEQVTTFDEINIGLALATENGWVMPVIHHTDRLSIVEIANKRLELETLAHNGKVQMEDTLGGTFTILNLGVDRIDSVDIVVNGAQAAILAVGRTVDQVIPRNGANVIQPVMDLSFSIDPRAIDGHNAAKFLETLAEIIEEPLMLLG